VAGGGYLKPFPKSAQQGKSLATVLDYPTPLPRNIALNTKTVDEPPTPAATETLPLKSVHPVITKEGGQQTIIDHGDTFLTISIDIGNQLIAAIPDSGSFELYIVDGDDCDLSMCKPAYKPESSSFHFTPTSPLKKEIYFGSGTCGVELSFDAVHVHNEKQPEGQVGPPPENSNAHLVPLWRIVEMDENLAGVWGDGSGFQGIVGLGFKGNTHKDSKELLLEEQVLLEARQKTASGTGLTKPGMASQALFGEIFAICLPRGEDANAVEVFGQDTTHRPRQNQGRLWWGNQVPGLNWMDTKVVGTRHWTMAIESANFQHDANVQGAENLHTLCGGPGMSDSAPCAALVDSGTSLIAMSEEKINKILATTIVGSLNPDCSNVNEMPDLIFNLGANNRIVLTPDSYVMKIEATNLPMMHEKSGRVILEKGKILNIAPPPKSLVSLKGRKPADSITYCTHAFMETPMETAIVNGKEHELLILGIPVFREYSIKFDRENEVMGFAQHPFGTTCHDLVRSDGKPVSSSFSETASPRHFNIRSLGKLHDLVFPDEFASL